MSIPIDMTWIYILIFVAALGYFAFFRYRMQMVKWAPEAKVLIEARKTNSPVAMVHERRNVYLVVPKFIEGLYHITTKKRNFGLIFDMRKEADKVESGIDGLRWIHCYVNHSSTITGAEAKAIAELHEERPVVIDERVFWECLRMDNKQLRENHKVLGINTEEELAAVIAYKAEHIKAAVPPKPGIFSFEEAMRALNPGQAAGHVLNLKNAWKREGALESMSQKFDAKIVLTAAVALAGVIMAGAIAFMIIKDAL